MLVVLPLDVMTPVRLALVVTVAALPVQVPAVVAAGTVPVTLAPVIVQVPLARPNMTSAVPTSGLASCTDAA